MLRTTSQKLFASLGAVLVTVTAGGVVTFSGFSTLDQAEARVARAARVQQEAGALRLSVAQVWQFLTDASAVGDAGGIDEARVWAKEFAKAIAALKDDGADPLLLAKLETAFARFEKVGVRMANTYIDEGREAGNVVMTEFDAAGEVLVDRSRAFLEQSQRSMAEAQEAARDERTLLVRVQGTSITLILVLVVLTTVITVGALRKLVALRDVAAHVAAGELQHDVEVVGQDEIADLATAFKRMLETLREHTRHARALAQSLSAATAQIGASVTEATAALTEQASAVAEAASAVSELEATASSTDERAQEVLRATRGTVTGLGDIQAHTERAADEVTALSRQTEQIQDILDTVADLADQSNILALNASIEAAKVGEAGKGFEVVASEVRNLAEQSQAATQRIRSILRDLGDAMNRTSRTSTEGRAQISNYAGQLETSAGAIEVICTAAGEQRRALGEVSWAINTVSSSVEQSKSSAQSIQLATQDLVTQAEALRDSFAGFQL